MAEEAPAELIDQAKRDPSAFGFLYDLYVNRIYGFALSHSKTREEAEDLTALTFERALAAILPAAFMAVRPVFQSRATSRSPAIRTASIGCMSMCTVFKVASR